MHRSCAPIAALQIFFTASISVLAFYERSSSHRYQPLFWIGTARAKVVIGETIVVPTLYRLLVAVVPLLSIHFHVSFE